MINDRSYFLVSSKSPVMGLIKESIRVHAEFVAAGNALVRDFGGKDFAFNNSVSVRLVGISFEDTVPAGWRKIKDSPVCIPDLKTKVGRITRSRIDGMPDGVGPAWISDALTKLFPEEPGGYTHWAENHVAWSTLERLGDHYVVVVPDACGAHPSGCRKLKMSEYWKLREKAEVMITK